jgi:mRNA-degrading endonuclease YafQ of YafQ-DinJ toxin-antitoxin module
MSSHPIPRLFRPLPRSPSVKTDVISEAMTTFDRCKRAVPPEILPATMKDHKLNGPFKGYMECHLEHEALLIYKPMPNGAEIEVARCTAFGGAEITQS